MGSPVLRLDRVVRTESSRERRTDGLGLIELAFDNDACLTGIECGHHPLACFLGGLMDVGSAGGIGHQSTLFVDAPS